MTMPQWLDSTFQFLLTMLPGGLWMAFWFFAVDWKRLRAFLVEGAWMPVLLLVLMSGVVWGMINPNPCSFFGVSIASPLWQICCSFALAAVALFSGWLQTISGFTPSEVPLEPAAEELEAHSH